MESSKTVIEHGYFAVTGFSMHGGDIHKKGGFAIFEEALIWAKGAINYDESKCATILRSENVYTVYVKQCKKTSPNKSHQPWKQRSNIFYGKRFKFENSSESKLLANSLAEFDYYFISSLDMYGADIRDLEQHKSFNEAYDAMKNAINYDGTKCGSIFQNKPNIFTNYMKDAKGTDPAKSPYHVGSSSVFFGRKV